MKTQNQRGYIWRVGKSWFGRWYREELVLCKNLSDKERKTLVDKGVFLSAHSDVKSRVLVTRQHSEKLCEYGDRFRSKKDVQPLLTAKLLPANEGRERPESTMSVSAYAEDFFLPFAERELKPSTAFGYKQTFRIYLKPRLTKIALRDFRCVDATSLLSALHREHGLGRRSLRHCKALVSVIFKFAKRNGILDGENPTRDAGIPRSVGALKPTYAYSAEEVFAMLGSIEGIAKRAVALMYFCGLRPGEARAARWENYDGKTLRIGASMWHDRLTAPKTAESEGEQPVPEILRDILAESRRESGYILAGRSGRCTKCGQEKSTHASPEHEFEAPPVNLANVALRTIRPALARCAECHQEKSEHDDSGHEFKPLPKWMGWYGFRRGLATLATSLDTALAAKSLLRHSNIATTQAHYIKSIPSDALRAVEKMDALFQKSGNSVLPN